MIDIITGMDGADNIKQSSRGSRVFFSVVVFIILAAVATAGAYWLKAHRAAAAAVVTSQQSLDAVRAADTQWAKAAGAHDLNAVLLYYADGAFVLAPNREAATKVLDIRKVWSDMLVKGTDATWTPGVADISSSGDMVYQEGYYILTTTPQAKGKGKAAGAPSIDRGKYLEVWKKQADGSWKCVADTWNSDMPAKK